MLLLMNLRLVLIMENSYLIDSMSVVLRELAFVKHMLIAILVLVLYLIVYSPTSNDNNKLKSIIAAVTVAITSFIIVAVIMWSSSR